MISPPGARDGDIGRLADFASCTTAPPQPWEKLILSSENFSLLDPARLAAIHDTFAVAETTVLCYLRAPCERLYPMWQKAAKHGDCPTLPDFVSVQLADPEASSTLNDAIFLARAEEVFGVTALQLVSYDQIVRSRQDLFSHFLREIVGVPSSGERINVSLPPAFAEVLRALNEIHLHKHGEPSAEVRFSLMRHLPALPEVRPLMRRLANQVGGLEVDTTGAVGANLCKGLLARYGARLCGSLHEVMQTARTGIKIKYALSAWASAADASDSLHSLYTRLQTSD